jgi:hypothetical protein
VSASIVLGFGLVGTQLAVRAESSTMPAGYTLSRTQLPGQHCYRHNNEENLYCYPFKLTEAMMKKHQSAMQGNTMMKKDDAMMMKPDTMMKKDDAMMKKDDSMMKGQ